MASEVDVGCEHWRWCGDCHSPAAVRRETQRAEQAERERDAHEATIEQASKNAVAMLDRLVVLERVAEAALAWWGSKRPVSWSDAEHRASPRVNCTTIGEDMLADACAALAARGKDGR